MDVALGLLMAAAAIWYSGNAIAGELRMLRELLEEKTKETERGVWSIREVLDRLYRYVRAGDIKTDVPKDVPREFVP